MEHTSHGVGSALSVGPETAEPSTNEAYTVLPGIAPPANRNQKLPRPCKVTASPGRTRNTGGDTE